MPEQDSERQMFPGDFQLGEIDDDETDSTDETDSSSSEQQDDGSTGFVSNGITKNEALALIGVTIPTYVLAGFVLVQMVNHGLHHAPIPLWVVFGMLSIIPLALMFGTDLATRMLETIVNARRKHK